MAPVSQKLRAGIAAAQARQFGKARPLLQQVTEESPDDPIGWFWLAIVSSSADQAMPCLRRVLKLDASHEQARTALAKLLLAEANTIASSGLRAAARDLVTEASQVAPRAQSVWLALAVLSDDPDERINALRQAVAIAPDDQQVRTRLRQALLTRGLMLSMDRPAARACFREAATFNPGDPRVWLALAKLADSPADSVDALRELLRFVPHYSGGRGALRNALAADARALTAAERTDDACERWREAMTLSGGDVETWLGVAATTSNPDEAARAVETAYKLNPNDDRAAAAMERLRCSRIDPSAIEAPLDAFARFDALADGFASIEPADQSFEQLDSTLDAFAELPMAVELATAVEPPSVDAVVESEPVVDSPVCAPEPIVAVTPIPESNPVTIVSAAEPEATAVSPETTAVVTPVLESARVDVHALLLKARTGARPAMRLPEDESPVPVPAPPAAPRNGSPRSTVMVVDDSPTIRKILGLTLERAGYTVVAEPDGESAIERLVQVVPDLILLDIAMPKLDGYDVCKRIKQDPRTSGVPVVMLSGKGAFFDKVKGHMAGASEYLTKPFETPAVLAVVKTHCPSPVETVNG
jgi:twitching motility two-component system response regulator PilG